MVVWYTDSLFLTRPFSIQVRPTRQYRMLPYLTLTHQIVRVTQDRKQNGTAENVSHSEAVYSIRSHMVVLYHTPKQSD